MKLVELLGQLGERIHEVEAGQSELGESAFGQLDTDAGDVRIKLTLLPGFPYTPPRVEILEE